MTDWMLQLGWNDDFSRHLEPYLSKNLAPARVISVYRKQLRVISHRGEHWARTGGRLMHSAENLGEFPAVGDWVAARIPENGEALVHTILPRKSAFIRKVAGENAAPHVLATNIDTVMIVMGLDGDFNVRRLERYLTLTWESRARPVIVLNKQDLATDLDAQVATIRQLAKDTEIRVISALNELDVANLRPLFGPGQTVALLGSSGVGKSTLVNRLAGSAISQVGTVRDDGRGRHTTTRHELLLLPGGGAIVDTPGLREVQMWDAATGLALAFDDIELLSQACRFTDCQHEAEPGCAVKAALDSGELQADRFEGWRSLHKELLRLEQPSQIRGRPETRRKERVGHRKR